MASPLVSLVLDVLRQDPARLVENFLSRPYVRICGTGLISIRGSTILLPGLDDLKRERDCRQWMRSSSVELALHVFSCSLASTDIVMGPMCFSPLSDFEVHRGKLLPHCVNGHFTLLFIPKGGPMYVHGVIVSSYIHNSVWYFSLHLDSLSTQRGLYGSVHRLHPSEQEDQVSCGIYTLFWGLQLFCGQGVDSLADPRVSVPLKDFRLSLCSLLTLLQETIAGHIGSSRRRKRPLDFHCRGSYTEIVLEERGTHSCHSSSLSISETPACPPSKISRCANPRYVEIPSRSLTDPSFEVALSKYVTQVSPKRVLLTRQLSLEAFQRATHVYIHLKDLGLVEWVHKRRCLCCFLLLDVTSSVVEVQSQVEGFLQSLGPGFILNPRKVTMCPSLCPRGLDSFHQLLLIMHRRVMGRMLKIETDLDALKEELKRMLAAVEGYLSS